MNPIADLIFPIAMKLGADRERADVIRTRYDEDREPVPSVVRSIVARRDKYRCVWCASRDHLQLDHVIPWSAGGGDTVNNLRLLCAECNQSRSNWTTELDMELSMLCGIECLKCHPDIRGEEGLETVWCVECKARGRGIPWQHPMASGVAA